MRWFCLLLAGCFPLHGFSRHSPTPLAPSGETDAQLLVQPKTFAVTAYAGDRFPIEVTIARPAAATGDVTVTLTDLPLGVSAEPLRLGATATSGALVVSTADTLAAALVTARMVASMPGATTGVAEISVNADPTPRVTVAAVDTPRGVSIAFPVSILDRDNLLPPVSVTVTSSLARVAIAQSGDSFTLSTDNQGMTERGTLTIAVTHGGYALPLRTVPLTLHAVAGTQDTAFGVVGATFGYDFVAVADAKITSDGAYFAATARGVPESGGAARLFVIVGKVDDTGQVSKVAEVAQPTNDLRATSIDVDTQGRILVSGQRLEVTSLSNEGSLIARVLPSGGLDPSFASVGFIVPEALTFNVGSICTARSVYAVGNLVAIVGQSSVGGSCFDDAQSYVVFTDDSGTVAPSGMALAGASDATNYDSGSAMNSAGAVVVFGTSHSFQPTGADTRGRAFRLDSLDPLALSPTFAKVVPGEAGVVASETFLAAAGAANGAWYLVGTSARETAGAAGYYAARVNADGTPDAAFGTSGAVRFRLPEAPAGDAKLTAVAIDATGRALVLGDYYDVSANQSVAFFRLKMDGGHDASFVVPNLGTQASASRLLVDSKGRAWVFACGATEPYSIDCRHPSDTDATHSAQLRIVRYFID